LVADGAASAGCSVAGAAAVGGTAEATEDAAGRVATIGFFFFAASFFEGFTGAGCNSTWIGFGVSRVEPVMLLREPDGSGCNATVCVWYPLSASVIVVSPPPVTLSSQGVRQLWPDAVLASAPGG
jgi:hypothetical protein